MLKLCIRFAAAGLTLLLLTTKFISAEPPANDQPQHSPRNVHNGKPAAVRGSNHDVLLDVPTIQPYPAYLTQFNNPAIDTLYWKGTGEFVLSNSFAKLGGPLGGYSWVTNPGPPGTSYNSPSVSAVLSPYFNLSLFNDVYISFFHSMRTEPARDFSLLQYTLDSGATWVTAGQCNGNDPYFTAVNWYGGCAYDSRCLDSIERCFAVTSWNQLVGLSPTGDNNWTSDGDCHGPNVPTGPFGWVFSRMRLSGLEHKPSVRFRYLAFADSSGAEDGWAFDNFHITNTGFLGRPDPRFSGKVYNDLNGNGQNDAEPPQPGVTVVPQYYKCSGPDYVTDSNGDYSFNMPVPGTYYASIATTKGISQPTSGSYTFFNSETQFFIDGNNFGLYDGSIIGTVFDDINNNGVNDDGVAGLAGFTVEARVDSCNGSVYHTDTTNAFGAYSFPVGSGTCYIKVRQRDRFRQSYPNDACHTVVISGSSGSGTSYQSNIDFGVFKLNTVAVSLVIDQNGNGIKEAEDTSSVPGTPFEVYEFSKNGAVLSNDTLGIGNVSKILHADSDTGIYHTRLISGTTTGWVHTTGGVDKSAVVTTSGQTVEILHMDFKLITASGQAFHDLNGNGIKDSNELPLAGWNVNINGNFWAQAETTAVTDTNGFWMVDSIFSYSHIISLVLQPGWLSTSEGLNTYGFNGATGNDQTNKNFGVYYIGGPTMLYDSLKAGWNMASVPTTLLDYAKTTIFPEATTNAFAYEGTYVIKNTLENNVGYWIKFANPTIVGIMGTRQLRDTMDVNGGWNLIGSFDQAFAPSNLSSVPVGITTSKFFGYDGAYFVTDSLRPGKAYWVKANQSGKLIISRFSNSNSLSTITIKDLKDVPPQPPVGAPIGKVLLPTTYSLEQNYPNPFNPTTVIRYQLPVTSKVVLKVYDFLGREIATVVDQVQDAGFKSVEWNAGSLPSGVYVYRLQAGTFVQTRKLVLMK